MHFSNAGFVRALCTLYVYATGQHVVQSAVVAA